MTHEKRRAREIESDIRQVLLRHWDPIGVCEWPEAFDEYDSYIGPVYRLLAAGRSDDELTDYLIGVERDRMGLDPRPRPSLAPVIQRLRLVDISLSTPVRQVANPPKSRPVPGERSFLETLIQAAAGGRLDAEAMKEAARAEAVSIIDLCDLFAATVAHRFLDGHMSYEVGDTAMNALFGFAYQGGGPGLQPIAWKVFIAFDEGEYLRPDKAEMQGEIRTRWLLEEIVELRGANHQSSLPLRCPCCLCMTLRERGGFEICPVCFWEDDGQDDHDADEVRGGPNGSLSLTGARANYRSSGASEPRFVTSVRPPTPEELPD